MKTKLRISPIAAPKMISPPMAIARPQDVVGIGAWIEASARSTPRGRTRSVALTRLGICVLPSSGAQIIMPAMRNRTST